MINKNIQNKFSNLNSLFLAELVDLYNSENLLINTLPKMAQEAISPELIIILEKHLEQTKNHLSRLKDAFKSLAQNPVENTNIPMKRIIEEGKGIVGKSNECASLDLAIIKTFQEVEHYELTAYEIAHSLATILGHKKIMELLNKTIQEENDAHCQINVVNKRFI